MGAGLGAGGSAPPPAALEPSGLHTGLSTCYNVSSGLCEAGLRCRSRVGTAKGAAVQEPNLGDPFTKPWR